MIKEKAKDIREKSLEQLYKDVNILYKDLREARFKIASRETKDMNLKSKLKKKIAQVMTIIQEKELKNILENIK